MKEGSSKIGHKTRDDLTNKTKSNIGQDNYKVVSQM